MMEVEPKDGGVEGEEDENNRLFRLDPFVQPPILKALFEQIPVEDLAKCRLVSKLWCNESLSTWRSRTTLKFGREGIRIASSRAESSRPTISIGEFLDLWEAGELGSCPFKKFFLHRWNFEAGDVEQERFLELMGGHVTSLTLESCSFVVRENFQRIVYQAFPKLQFLKMVHCKVDNVIYRHASAGQIVVYKEPAFGVHGLKSLAISECLPDMMDMLSHFHKLRSLRLEPRNYRSEPVENYRSLLETIRLIRAQDRTNLPLKNFDVKSIFCFVVGADADALTGRLNLLEQLNLRLQRLEIYFNLGWDEDIDRNLNVFRDILQYHSSTLKFLKFGGNDVLQLCKSFPFGFDLENLEELEIPPCFTDNLNYLRCTPKLRVLNTEEDKLSLTATDNLFSNSRQLDIGDWTLPSLTKLTFDLPWLSACNLGKLMKWMPNVERVRWISLDDFKFAMICKNWKNLKFLDDRGDKLTDEGVVGIGNGLCNITQLKNLTSFTTFSSQLTSASVHDGFLKLAKLRWLTLGLGESTEIDEEARAALIARNIKLHL